MTKKGISTIRRWEQIFLNAINVSKINPGICSE
jgi:hypothetical protein